METSRLDSINRRKFIQIMGAGGVVLAAQPLVGCAGNEGSNSAPDQPWHVAGSGYSDPLRRALSYAILAPNPHNRQPWLVDLNSQNLTIDLYCDQSRKLPDTDPFDRQILIGLGCFSELLTMAAMEDGYKVDAEWFPQGTSEAKVDNRLVAKFRFIKSNVSSDPLFKQILARRSSRIPFDTEKGVKTETLQDLVSGLGDVQFTNQPSRVKALRKITTDAITVELNTDSAWYESVHLTRIGNSEVAANPDGISLGGTMMGMLKLFGMMSREKMMDRNSTAFKQGLQMQVDQMQATPSYVWVTTSANTRRDQLNAGQQYVRMNMKAAELGLLVHPVSQSLQEYSEMAELYKQVHKELNATGNQRVQMLARIGYGEASQPSPRWPLDSRIRNS